jgi:hypothetical protein
MAPYMMKRRYIHMITPLVRLHEKWAGGIIHELISVASMETAPSFKPSWDAIHKPSSVVTMDPPIVTSLTKESFPQQRKSELPQSVTPRTSHVRT